MLAPTTIFLLASYVGPVASPETNLDTYRYANPPQRPATINQTTPSLHEKKPETGSLCIDRMSVSECAKRGRMVVPGKFR